MGTRCFTASTRYFLSAALAWICFAVMGWAQASASITGTVRDTSGAVVPEATVTVKNIESGLTRTVETDSTGRYSVPALPVGHYQIDAQKTGFKQHIRQGITLVVAQQAVVDLTVEVGAVEEQVTVTGEAPLVNTTLSSTAGLVGEQQVKDLPLNGRSFDQLLTLNVATANYTSNTSHVAAGNSFAVAGRRPDENRYIVNGVDLIGTDATGGAGGGLPSGASQLLLGVDAVREFNVLQDTYGAEYGKRAGAQISVVTSSGTNQLHGSAFEFLRNSALDARNFFDKEGVPPFKRNQFGGTLGGPLKRDKLFLFGNYEGFRQRLGLSNVAVVPNVRARQGILPIGPGNTEIVVPDLEPRILPYLNTYWPLPNGPELGGGLALNFSNPAQKIHEDFALFRFDDNISGKDSLSASYIFDDGQNDTPSQNPNFISIAPMRYYFATMQETRVFSPTLLNVATFGFGRATTIQSVPPTVPIPSSLLFITNTLPGSISIGGGVATSTTGSVSTITTANGINPFFDVRNHFDWADDLHYTKGGHTVSAGIWIQRMQQNVSGAPVFLSGSVSYPTLMATLQDRPSSFITVASPTELGFRSTEAAWYIQDEIKLKPNLTLRLGLRDEMTTGWNEAFGRSANYIYDSGLIRSVPLIGASSFIQNNAIALWQPRVGIAWDPTGSGKWSVRAGFGIYNDLQDSLANRMAGNWPFNARATYSNTPLFSIIPLPGGTPPPPPCSAELQAARQTCGIFEPAGVEPTMHTPTIQQWSFTIERQLASNLLLRVGYVGVQSYHVPVWEDKNMTRAQVCSNPAGCASGGIQGAVAQVPQGITYIPPGPRPNPFVADTLSQFNEGVGNYNGVNISLVKRMSHGLTFKVDYTYQKLLDLQSVLGGSYGQNEPQVIRNPFDLKLDKGIAGFNVPHQFNTHFTYQLPFGRGQHWGSGAGAMTERLIGGWQWNGIITVQSGFPFTPLAGSNVSGSGDPHNVDVPDRNPGFTGKVIVGKPNEWYDPHAFQLPIRGTFGNISRGAFQGPALATFDTSVFKSFQVNERLNLQFRAEAFNLFNSVNFAIPNLNVFSGNSISSAAGIITNTATSSRQLQLALKLSF